MVGQQQGFAEDRSGRYRAEGAPPESIFGFVTSFTIDAKSLRNDLTLRSHSASFPGDACFGQ